MQEKSISLTEQDKNILRKYLPEKAVDRVVELILYHKIHFKISSARKTKFGDYRPPVKKPYHRISVNHDLNKYAFLITFIHEVAHLRVYEKFKHNVSAPHGKEWKTEYRELMKEFLERGIFPNDLEKEISKSIVNSKASSSSELNLFRTLKKYDVPSAEDNTVALENLPEGQVFRIHNGETFKKGEKQRIRYRCYNLNKKQWYLFHPLTQVIPV